MSLRFKKSFSSQKRGWSASRVFEDSCRGFGVSVSRGGSSTQRLALAHVSFQDQSDFEIEVAIWEPVADDNSPAGEDLWAQAEAKTRMKDAEWFLGLALRSLTVEESAYSMAFLFGLGFKEGKEARSSEFKTLLGL